MKPASWTAWYSDGSVYRSAETAWRDLPRRGVLIVRVDMDQECAPGKPYRRMVGGCDWYWLDASGDVQGVRSKSWGGQWEKRPEGVDPADIKQGVKVSDMRFFEAQQDAWER